MAVRLRNLLSLTLGLSVLTGVLGFARTSQAYCRATTCDPALEDCEPDEHGCLTRGVRLWWRRGQVDLVVGSAGSEFSAIDEQQAFLALSGALQSYSNVVCMDDGPRRSFVLSVLGSGGPAAPNDGQNGVSFIDAGWPYEPGAVARTTISFDSDSGELLEADIELNSEDFTFAIEPIRDQIDLQAVLTHEVGHVLGLAHSDVPGATMQPETSGFGVVELRTLEEDDTEGLCAVHADSWQAEPPRDDGGCSVTGTSPKGNTAVAWLALLTLGICVRRLRAAR